MRTKLFLFGLLLVIFSAQVFAQIDNTVILKSGAVCGNGVRDEFEPCDKSSNASDNDLCPQIGKVAGIAMVCREELCSCLPRKYIICGDKHTKGNEMCDANDKDFCPQVGKLFGKNLECNTKSCLCKAGEDVIFPSEQAVNTSNITTSLCGNRQVDSGEQCDPSGRQCTFGSVSGVCSDDCKCKEVESESVSANVTASIADSSTSQINGEEGNKTNDSTVSDASAVKEEVSKTKTEVVEQDVGVSDNTYTVLLIVFVIVFVIALAIGSFFIYKRSQIGDFDSGNTNPPQSGQ